MPQPIILITGAARGIGLAAAGELVRRGARVVVAARDAIRAKAAAEACGAESLVLDISDAASVRIAVSELTHRLPHLDVLINNAAILLDHYASIRDLSPDDLRRTLETNLIGTFRLTQALLPLLEKSGAPRIVNVSSGAGQMDGEPQAWAPAYAISKAALNMLTQQLTAALPELAVNSVCPGWCRTEMGGKEAPRSAEEGANTIVWLALEAPHSLRGGFFRDRKTIPW